jgi:predicted GIY-YIG superfamily endonuclease
MYYVYILKCKDGKYYTGCTSDLKGRFRSHAKGQVSETSDKLPVELLHYSAFIDKYKAFNFERYLKTGSGRAFMKKRFV